MMSDNVLIAIVAAVPGVVASVLSFFNRSKLSEVKEGVNGRLTELLKLTREHYYAKGKGDDLSEEHPADRARRLELEEEYRFEPSSHSSHRHIHRIK